MRKERAACDALSLHDALPILEALRIDVDDRSQLRLAHVGRRCGQEARCLRGDAPRVGRLRHELRPMLAAQTQQASGRSEEHTSELQSPDHIVCRLLLEKTKKI